MNKKQLHHLWTRIRPIKAWYLVVLFLCSSTIAVFALRSNNLRMVELRNQVYVADEKNQDVEAALQRLRAHVYGHMNTKLSGGDNAVYPPIQLKHTYQRLVDAEKTRSQQNNSAIYTAAQAYCEAQNPNDFSGRNRVPCIERYVSERNVRTTVIPDAMYKFDFISPMWSPDVAGFSFAAALIFLILAVARIIAGYLFKRAAKS